LPRAKKKALGKGFFAECQSKTLGKAIFQTTFWCPKRIQIKKFSTTKFHNFSWSTNFILVISLFDKVIITLFTKSICLSCSSMKLQERYIRFVNNVSTTISDGKTS
jgi:hypothetical protein